MTESIRSRIEVSSRPLTGGLYEALVRSAASLATALGFIIRSDEVVLTGRGAGLLRELQPYLIRIERVNEWPGTRLIGGRKSLLHLYQVTPKSLALVLAETKDMFAWVNPELPEDLHLLRADGTTILGSIAQEDAVWLELDERELQQTLADAPLSLRAALAF